MTPPDWLREWGLALGPWATFAVILVGAGRKLLVEPLLREWHAHAAQHELLLEQLTANGSEELLPKEEQHLPLRTLLIRSRVEAIEHVRLTAPLVAQYLRDLRERGVEV